MTKTQEKLNQLKQEYESLATKLSELDEDEFEEVCAGVSIWDIAVKLKEKFNVSNNISTHGGNGKPTLPLWDGVSSELINNSKYSK